MGMFRSFIACEKAATSIEYGLIAALISIVIVTVVTGIGTKLRTKFTVVSNSLGS